MQHSKFQKICHNYSLILFFDYCLNTCDTCPVWSFGKNTSIFLSHCNNLYCHTLVAMNRDPHWILSGCFFSAAWPDIISITTTLIIIVMMMIVIIIVIIRADTHSYKAILIRESRRNLAVANNDSDSEYDDIIDSEY